MTSLRPKAIADRDIWSAALLLLVAGVADAVAFIVLQGQFVSFMSGNTTILGSSAGVGKWGELALPAGLLVAFFFGAALGAAISRWGGAGAAHKVTAVVVVILTCGALVANTISLTGGMFAVAVATGSINSVLSKSTAVSGGLTYVTGTLVKAAQQMVDGWGTRRAWMWLTTFWMWVVFLLGAMIGGYSEHLLGASAMWVAVALAAAVWVIQAVPWLRVRE